MGETEDEVKEVDDTPEIGRGQVNVPQAERPIDVEPIPEVGGDGGVNMAHGTPKETLQ